MSGPRLEDRPVVVRPRRRDRWRAAAWALCGAGIATQIAFPLTGGGTLVLTVVAVALLAGAAVADAVALGGPRAGAALLVVAGGGGLLAEAVGVRTGLPFGGYHYDGTLGPQLVGVPLLVPLAWVMEAWPALLVARRLCRSRLAVAVVGAWALTAWDVFLDPQMVDAGHWTWDDPTPSLPGVAGIPLTNFAGWLLVSFVLVALLDRLVSPVPRLTRGGDAVGLTVYVWTYLSSVLAAVAFFGRPTVGLVGALVMGFVAVPLVRRLARP